MKHHYSLFVIIALIFSIGINSFAQNQDERVEALQGEWQCVMLHHGEEVIDFTEAPYAEFVDNIWKFEGNNFFSVIRNLHDGTSQVDMATFTIVGRSLVLSDGERADAYSYTLEDDILTAAGDGFTFILVKQR